MKKTLLFLIKTYRHLFSPDTGVFQRKMPTCIFYPTCSAYAQEAVEKYGAVKGVYLSIRRIIRCHPWQKKHIDIVQ
jgi:putative membrane protein insertion efficiency factor